MTAIPAQGAIFTNNTHYRVCFTPGQQCTALIRNVIRDAKKSIYVQAYSFTSPKIANALIGAYARGVKITIILDKSQLHSRYSQLKSVLQSGIPIYIDNKVAIAHNKVMIFDHRMVLTGSFNFTRSAQKRNAENIIVINSGELAKIYYRNYQFRLSKSYKVNGADL